MFKVSIIFVPTKKLEKNEYTKKCEIWEQNVLLPVVTYS